MALEAACESIATFWKDMKPCMESKSEEEKEKR